MANVDELDRDEFEVEDEDDLYDDEYDDEELDDDDEFDEEDDTDDDDEDSEESLRERLKKEATDEIVKMLSSGDQNTPIYKGLQRVISQKDREINETRQALASLAEQVNKGQSASAETNDSFEFLMNTFKEVLNEDDRKVLDQKYDDFKKSRGEKSRLDNIEGALKYITESMQGRTQSPRDERPESNDMDERLAQLRKEATEELRGIAETNGFDPDDENLDFGSEDEPLLERIRKLRGSIAKASEVEGVRRKKKRSRTRKDPDGSSRVLYTPGDARRTLEAFSQSFLEQARKNNR